MKASMIKSIQKNKGGRPTKYRENYPQMVLDWLDKRKDSYTTTPDGKEELRVDIPLIEELEVLFKISKDTLYKWVKAYPKFSDSLREVKNEQLRRLANNSLSGKYNNQIARLILSTNHGYHEKVKEEKEVNINYNPIDYMSQLKDGVIEAEIIE